MANSRIRWLLVAGIAVAMASTDGFVRSRARTRRSVVATEHRWPQENQSVQLKETVKGVAPSMIDLNHPKTAAARLTSAIVLRPPRPIEDQIERGLGFSPFENSSCETRVTTEGAYSTIAGMTGTTVAIGGETTGWRMYVVQDAVEVTEGAHRHVVGRIFIENAANRRAYVVSFDADIRTGPRADGAYVEVIDALVKWHGPAIIESPPRH